MDRLYPVIYGELRRLAGSYLRRERPDHTLQSTALVNEAYLRLCGDSTPDYQDRIHFIGVAARNMRQILVDHARHRNARKRSSAMKMPLDEAIAASNERPAAMIALDEALSDLEKYNERRARLIEMRFFGGLTAEESAEALGLTAAAVRKELRLAQAWLERELAPRAGA